MTVEHELNARVLRYVSKKNRPCVTGAWHDSDGYWIMLDNAFLHDGAHTIHTETVEDLRRAARDIYKAENCDVAPTDVILHDIELKDYRIKYSGEFQHRPAGIVLDIENGEVYADFSAGNGIPENFFSGRAVFCGFDSRLRLSIVREYAFKGAEILSRFMHKRDAFRQHGRELRLSSEYAEQIDNFCNELEEAGNNFENWDKRLSA